MNAYLFNPENDLALAAGTAAYTPPRNARLLHESGAALPVWYADGLSQVIADGDRDKRWIESVCRLYDIDVEPVSRFSGRACAMPWGWSDNAVRQFERLGIERDCLPTPCEMRRHRQLSHRRTSVEVLGRLGVDNLPVEARSAGEVEAFSRKHDGIFFFKSPWSSTGRGVASSDGMPAREVLRRCEGIIARQGSVMLERKLDRVCDFAMLFRRESDRVAYGGLSLFSNEGNAYCGNLLLPDDVIAEKICSLTGGDTLKDLMQSLPGILTEVLGDAAPPWFGVDMMVCREGPEMKIFPCVEVNLRMTMGVVAHVWRERHLAPGVGARLEMSAGAVTDDCNPVVESGRLVAGRQPLVVPGGDFAISVVTC